MKLFTSLIFTLFICFQAHTQIFVSQLAMGSNDGSSWANAYTDLQDALSEAATNNGADIWVAVGQYRPVSCITCTDADREQSFEIPNNTKVYGGFSGSENALGERDFENNISLLSGEIGDLSDSTDNIYTIVKMFGDDCNSRVDGFTIRYANGDGNLFRQGGGIKTNENSCVEIYNCTFKNNYSEFGGAIFVEGMVNVHSCTFEDNVAKNGGAIYIRANNDSTYATVRLSQFSHNAITTSTSHGAAIAAEAVGLVSYLETNIMDCTFTGHVDLGDSGVGTLSAEVSGTNTHIFNVSNCIISNNEIDKGGAISVDANVSGCASNCIVENNHSRLGGGFYTNSSDFKILHCTIKGNNAEVLGGGIFSNGTKVESSLLFENSAINAGAIYAGTNDSIIHCTVVNNYAVVNGAGCYSYADSSYLENSIFAFNTTDGNTENADVYASQDDYILIKNSIISTDPSSQNYFIQGDNVLLTTDPLFADTATNDFSLLTGSPAIDAASETHCSEMDLYGNNRVMGCSADMGAIELTSTLIRIFVDSLAASNGDGKSWASAYNDLQLALTEATGCIANIEIWIAKGTYFPTTGSDRFASFDIPSGVKIYGGFIGNEIMVEERNWTDNLTVLSGDIGTKNDLNDNAYHVVTMDHVSDSTLIDGLIISFGNANGPGIHQNGGGLLNKGGTSGSSSPKFRHCIFQNNKAGIRGGAVYNNGQVNGDASPLFDNCAFLNNESNQNGGAMFNRGVSGKSDPLIINCTFAKNTAVNGGAILNDGGGFQGNAKPIIQNSIFWDNTGTTADPSFHNISSGAVPIINFSLIQDAACPAGTNCGANMQFNIDPLFVDINTLDIRLSNGSPAVESGSNVLTSGTTDLHGNERINCCVVDLGAIENDGCTNVIYVDQFASGMNNGYSWANAYNSLQDALTLINTCNSFNEIWVAKGDYYPSDCANCPPVEREKSFVIEDGIKMYGGFAGNESSRGDRNPFMQVTRLNGNIGQQQGNDNSYHIVRSTNAGPETIIDGFEIAFGNANSAGVNGNGAGILIEANGPQGKSELKILNCTFLQNSVNNIGGAVFINATSGIAQPTFANCLFKNNNALQGGAIASSASLPLNFSTPNFINCNFIENMASDKGGCFVSQGILSGNSAPQFANCIFEGNNATSGVNPTALELTGSMASISYSNIDENFCPIGNCGDGMLYMKDSEFMDAANGDYRIEVTSPLINVGLDSIVPAYLTTDFSGNDRIVDGRCDGVPQVDIGMFEAAAYTGSGILYVEPNAEGLIDGSSWENAIGDVQRAFQLADAYNCITEVWIKEGLHTVTNTGDRTHSYFLPKGKPVYGGFLGNETERTQRDWEANETILSGNIGDPNDSLDNSYHVIIIDQQDQNIILDGFTIEGGMADHNSNTVDQSGAGIYQVANPSGLVFIKNCHIKNNYALHSGGAIYSRSNTIIENCLLENNQAGVQGQVAHGSKPLGRLSFKNSIVENILGANIPWIEVDQHAELIFIGSGNEVRTK